jgi:hypothetical protein
VYLCYWQFVCYLTTLFELRCLPKIVLRNTDGLHMKYQNKIVKNGKSVRLFPTYISDEVLIYIQ